MTEHYLLVPVPGVGLLALTTEEAKTACLRAAEVLGSLSLGGFGSKPKDEAPVRPDDGLLSAEELAQRLGTSSAWVEIASRQKTIPYLQIGRFRKYSYSEVLAATKATGLKPNTKPKKAKTTESATQDEPKQTLGMAQRHRRTNGRVHR